MKRRTITRLAIGLAPAVILSACASQSGFDLADKNANQKISPKEFDTYMLRAVFAESDADGNGLVTFQEWKAANPDAEPAKFSAPDTNRDQMVSLEEARVHFEKQGTWADLFDKIDTDNDGFITSAEASAFNDKMEAQSGTPIQKLSQAADKK